MIIHTQSLNLEELSPHEKHQVYCGLDNCVTSEVILREYDLFHSNTNPRPNALAIYSFERALQGPYLEMMLRGFHVDVEARDKAVEDLKAQIQRLQYNLNQLTIAFMGKSINPNSRTQLIELFYEKLKFKEVYTSKKGVKSLSLDRHTLEKLNDTYQAAQPLVSHILAIRDLSKQLQVFETDIDSDNRFRSSYNIAGTETGRPSSSESAFGTGGNAQNIAPSLRHVFIPDPGYKLCTIDFEQSEARDVGFLIGCLFSDWTYLDACESGDVHTANARLIWPHLPWTNDLIEDRQIASRNFVRDFSYRDMAKRGSHLCLTEDHEVLTPHGWASITEKPRIIMAFSEHKSSFEEVSHWTDELYSERLVYFEGRSISLCMTENHRVPCKTDQRNIGPMRTKRAINGPGIHMPLGWGYKGGCEEVPARLIAAFMSDGYQASTNRMHFHLKKSRKIERLKYLCDLYEYQWESMRDIISVHGHLPKRAGAFMFDWTTNSIEDFLDEYKYWDGHVSSTAVALFSIDLDHLEWIQTFGRLMGIGGNIYSSTTQTNFGGTSKIYETLYHRLQQNSRRWAHGASVAWQAENVHKDYPVRVLCPTVPSSFFYVRREGKICVTGNSNYMGTAYTMAKHLKISQRTAEDFQSRYCRGPNCAFPSIPLYWQWVIEQLQTHYKIITPFGRERHFFSDSRAEATHREAIAFIPQSTTADRTNLGLWRVWKHMPQVQLLAQGYDSITFQALDDSHFEDIICEVAHHLIVPLSDPTSGRSYTVPTEAKIGYDWGSGLKKVAL